MTATRPDRQIPAKLLDWYDAKARALPWRALPGEPRPDPYRVWLSEIMLQQTTVAAVKPYFADFTARWPAVEALAAAPEEDVMAAWAGLGYYSRARNLVKAARAVADLGGFPDTEEGLRKLPGVGDYTAAAIAAIAFGRRAVVVDANVERVVARLFAIEQPLPAARKAIREAADTITPDERAGDFAQAMMDLGSRICTPRKPNCDACPLAGACAARGNDPERLPVKAPKKAKPVRQGRTYWIEREGHVWLVQRPPEGMLGGMRALPDDGWSARADGAGVAPMRGDWADAGAVRHTFTHFTIELTVLRLDGADPDPTGDGVWWPLEKLKDAGLPTLFAKAARLAEAARERLL
ncbi:A/G-specific adenine glycosylase [Citromicrobium sp. JLT1363]|uniref:A/G-specific adenine glycosylase n=1 Tax=Citromicrobium sp. JLT1363 TaxID=517722 RepID=UPI000225DEA8|nr:A/G-specific adenine glycosylase [Citromicrobium sp. JLT1363]